MSALRAASRRWPVKYDVIKAAYAGKFINKATGKMAMHYRCAACNELFVATQISVDHIDPVVSTQEGFVSWDVFIERLFCEAEGLQCLCKDCHKLKSDKERKERTLLKKEGKK